jgi:predicted DsbA family dithiol-disulfide isomerase
MIRSGTTHKRVALPMSVQAGQIRRVGIELFADYVCPFSYLAGLGVERVSAEMGITPVWRAFELRPPGTALQQPPTDAEWRLVEAVAGDAGVAINRPAFVPRTRKAHEATRHAATLGLATVLQRAIYDAYFLNGADIGRIDVLVDIAGTTGMDRLALKVALDIDAHSDEVAADRELAEKLEITGTPAYVAGNDVRIGLLTDEHLRTWLRD